MAPAQQNRCRWKSWIVLNIRIHGPQTHAKISFRMVSRHLTPSTAMLQQPPGDLVKRSPPLPRHRILSRQRPPPTIPSITMTNDQRPFYVEESYNSIVCIFVKTLTGKIITLFAEASDTKALLFPYRLLPARLSQCLSRHRTQYAIYVREDFDR